MCVWCVCGEGGGGRACVFLRVSFVDISFGTEIVI